MKEIIEEKGSFDTFFKAIQFAEHCRSKEERADHIDNPKVINHEDGTYTILDEIPEENEEHDESIGSKGCK